MAIMLKAMQNLDLEDNAKRVLAQGDHIAFDLSGERTSEERFQSAFDAKKLAKRLNDEQDAPTWVVVKLTVVK